MTTERAIPAVGSALELRVEKAVHGGLGLARADGLVVLMPRALPGERVEVRVESRERGYLRAAVTRVLEPSPARREPPCPHFPACGGCTWQALDYAAQLELKQAVLREALARAGVEWNDAIRVTPSPEQGWRTRVGLHAALAEGRLRLGLHRAESHEVVEVELCGQLSDAMRDTAARLARELDAAGLAGRASGLRLAESGDAARRVALVELPGERSVPPGLAALAREDAGLVGLGALLGRGARYVRVRGAASVDAEAAGVRYRAHAAAFFQANRHLLEPLVGRVLEELPPRVALLDLFAGVGLFAVAAATARGASAVAVEVSPLAARDAVANARAAGVADRVAVRRGDALDGVRGWQPAPGPRVVVVDPPRSGLSPRLCDALGSVAAERLVYVSCDPPSLGRDLARLLRSGWRVRRLSALDMFPDTFHLESVATLER